MLSKQPNLATRFELACGVMTTMCTVHENCPTLYFPDVKPNNFLLSALLGDFG